MPEDQQFPKQTSAGGDGELERLGAAVRRIESLLGRVLADYDDLRREHQQLTLDYHALKARTQSVGDEMDVTIERLKKWISTDASAEGEEGLWAR